MADAGIVKENQSVVDSREKNAIEPELQDMLSDEELKHIVAKWTNYKPESTKQAGNTTFMKSEINDVSPSSLHATYNAWQLKLQITWLLEYRGQPIVVPNTKSAMIQRWIELLTRNANADGNALELAPEGAATLGESSSQVLDVLG